MIEDFIDDTEVEDPSTQDSNIDPKKLEEAIGSNDPDLLNPMIDDYKKYIKVLKDKMYFYTTKVHSNELAFKNYFQTRTEFMDRLIEKEEQSQNEYENLLDQTKRELEDQERDRTDEIKELEREKGEEISNLQQKNAVFEEKIRGKESERERERNLIKERDELKKKLDEMRRDNREAKIQITCQKENEWIGLKEEREQITKKRKDVDEKKQTVYQKQQDFETERQEHMKHLDFLKEERNKILQQNRIARQNLIKNEDGLLEFQTLTFKQSKKIQELKEEIKILNEKFPEEVAKYTKELEFMKYDNQNKKSELEFRYQNLSDILRIKYRESKNLKKTLQQIMDQRSEIEHFVIEAIQEVSQQKDEEQESYFNPGAQGQDDDGPFTQSNLAARERESETGAKTGMPRHNQSGTSSQQNFKIQSGTNRVKTMQNQRTRNNMKKKFGWEDRQKILRIIFSKLNSGEIPIYWREIDVTELKKEILGGQSNQNSMIQSQKEPTEPDSRLVMKYDANEVSRDHPDIFEDDNMTIQIVNPVWRCPMSTIHA